MRDDDRRRAATGRRVVFGADQLQAWYIARMLRHLNPDSLRLLRGLAEACAHVEAEEKWEAEVGATVPSNERTH
jgi:hypothetical protein